MGFSIEDGKGTGKKLEVDNKNRAKTFSVTLPEIEQETKEGNGYNLTTGSINLTNASTENGLLYLSNTGESDLVITDIFVFIGVSTGGTGNLSFRTVRNPTGGTLISGGTTVTPVNRNFGSSLNLTATCLKGSSGSTVTGGDDVTFTIDKNGGRIALTNLSFVLPKGSSIAFALTTQASNTSMDAGVSFKLYETEE